jgi:hypothetical protein
MPGNRGVALATVWGKRHRGRLDIQELGQYAYRPFEIRACVPGAGSGHRAEAPGRDGFFLGVWLTSKRRGLDSGFDCGRLAPRGDHLKSHRSARGDIWSPVFRDFSPPLSQAVKAMISRVEVHRESALFAEICKGDREGQPTGESHGAKYLSIPG